MACFLWGREEFLGKIHASPKASPKGYVGLSIRLGDGRGGTEYRRGRVANPPKFTQDDKESRGMGGSGSNEIQRNNPPAFGTPPLARGALRNARE